MDNTKDGLQQNSNGNAKNVERHLRDEKNVFAVKNVQTQTGTEGAQHAKTRRQ